MFVITECILYLQLGLDDTNTNSFLTQVFSQSMMDYEDDKRLRTNYDEDLRRAIKISLEESKALPSHKMNLPSTSGLQNQNPSSSQSYNERAINQLTNVRVKAVKRKNSNGGSQIQSKKQAQTTIQADE